MTLIEVQGFPNYPPLYPDIRNSVVVVDDLLFSRPWGTFRILDQGPSYKVKILEVKPGGRLSLQRHKFRSESWTVLRGQATVWLSEFTPEEIRVFEFSPVSQLKILANVWHRLENRSDEPLRILEIQTGSYCEEDDIERFEDDYGRVKCSAES